MSIRKDLDEASKQLNDYLYPNGEGKSPVKIYKNVEPIGNKEWGIFRSDIMTKGRFCSSAILSDWRP